MARILFFLLLALQLVFGLSTVFIVQHWDEAKLVDSVIQQYSSNKFLPLWYNYPSLIFYLTYFDYFIWNLGFSKLIPEFNIFNRAIFYSISTIPSFLLFSVFQKRQLPWIGLISALIYMSSWEFHYHSRWVAPDTIAAALGMACIYFLLKKNQKSNILAALMAGLAFGTKYTCGIFILPVLIASFSQPAFLKIKNILPILGIFIVTFILSTPGVIFEGEKVIEYIQYEQEHYSKGHYGYTVRSFGSHLGKNLTYLFVALPAKNIILSSILSLLGLVGIIALIQKRKYIWLGVGMVAIGYVIYLSTQKVMFARNLMVCWPFLCLLMGYGIFYIYAITKKQRIVLLAVGLIGILSLASTVFTDIRILQAGINTPIEQFAKYAEAGKSKDIFLSPAVRNDLSIVSMEQNRFADSPDRANYFAFYLGEVDAGKIPTNIYGWVYKSFGIDEVNINYYPTYIGNHKILLVRNPEILRNGGIRL